MLKEPRSTRYIFNKNILNRSAPAVKYDHTASSGGL